MKCHRIQIVGIVFLAALLISGITRGAAAQGNTVYIDANNRVILNGEPFFPLGLYAWHNGIQYPDPDELDDIENSPFDTLMHYNTAVASDAENTAFLQALNLRGLKLIFSLYNGGCNDQNTICQMPWTISEFETFIEHEVTTFKDDPAIIAWYLNDEICPVCLDWLEAGYTKIKELDANHPVWSVHWHTGWLLQELHTTDIVGVDPHPNPITLTSSMADAANATGKPVWLVPHIYSATQAEMRAMTYLAVNHGAKGLIYYCYSALTPTRWSQIKGIASEVDQLRPVFLSTEQTNDSDVTCNNGNIDYKLMKNGDGYFLFAVNTIDGTLTGVTFQINLDEEPSTVEALFENSRQVDVTDANFADDFGVYEVHVYYWQGISDEDGDGVSDDEDNCPSIPNQYQEDSDIDGVGDACDGCPYDPDKITPGICGCGMADADSDGDGTPDCNDNCPNDPGKIDPGACGCGIADVDSDGDGTPDCNDNCPNDSNKTGPGVCGCGVPDVDSDGDQILDCVELSTGTNPLDTDTDNDGLPDGGPTGEDVDADGIVGPGETDPRDADTDGDGYNDGGEVGVGSDPLDVDSIPVVSGEAHRNEYFGVIRTDAPYARGDCAHCHDTFDPGICGVMNTMLFAELDGPDFCMECHTDTGSSQDNPMPAASEDILGVFQNTHKHNVTAYPTDPDYPHKFSPSEETRAYLSAHRHVECDDCHNPHTAEAGLHSSNEVHVPASDNSILGSPINGAFGVEPTWSSSNWGGATNWPSTSSTATKEYQICFKCHSSYNTNPSGWNSANVDWTDTTDPSAWTDVALEFNPSNQSYHPVAQALPDVDPGYNGSTDTYGSNRLPPAHTSLVIGDSGLKTGGAVGRVTDSSKNWATNQWQNWGVRFGSTDEAPAHSVLTHDYVRTIESNGSNQLIVTGYFPDASYLPDGVTVYSIEYYAGSGASKSDNTVTHSIKDFNRYLPSLVGYTVVIQDDPIDSQDTSVDWVATGVVQSNDATSFTVDSWSPLVGSPPASGTVAYYFSSTGQAMMCSDCHGNDEISTTAAQGPHGSAVKWMLKGRNRAWPASSAASNGAGYDSTPLYSVHYSYMGRYAPRYENDGTADGLFCLNCHSTVGFSKDGNGLQALGSPTENIHLEHNAPCIQCHVMVPHGSKNSRLIADQDDDISRYAYNNNRDNMGVTDFVMKAFGPGGRAAPEGYPTGSHGSSLYCSKNCHDVPVEAPW